MLWFLTLHIGAMLFWCGTLLYLPALISAGERARARAEAASHAQSPVRSDSTTEASPQPDPSLMPGELLHEEESVARFIYTRITTPAAVTAIIAGTLIFLPGYRIDIWLVAKLTLVAALVVCHVLLGVMVLRAEEEKPVIAGSRVLQGVASVLMLGIIWLVLRKPSGELLLWF
jgi:protoporphyrinogen IX oxidase